MARFGQKYILRMQPSTNLISSDVLQKKPCFKKNVKRDKKSSLKAMFEITEKRLYKVFYCICWSLALTMTLLATLKYIRNEDVIEISYRKFDTNKADAQYPSMSLCFVDAYKQSSFNDNSNDDENTINASSYSAFINGDIWDEKMLEIDYDEVTINLKEYLISTCMITTMSRTCQEIHKIDTVIFPSPLGVLKCFSFHHILGLNYNIDAHGMHDNVNLDEVMVSLNSSVFPNGSRPSSGRFLVMFHYPYQLVRSIYTTFLDWPSRATSHYYAMQFHIKSVETLKRRLDGNDECYDWKNFESKTIENVMHAVGCQPPYWKSRVGHYLPCNSSTQMKKIASHYQAQLYQNSLFQKVVPPCVEMKKIDVEVAEDIGDKSKNNFNNEFYEQFARLAGTRDDWLIIHLHFWAAIDFKEIKQIRAYSVMNAVGNAAGYLGFLLGVSISQLCVWVITQIKTIYKNKTQGVDGNKKSTCSTNNNLLRNASRYSIRRYNASQLSADIESKRTMDTRTEEENAPIHYVIEKLI